MFDADAILALEDFADRQPGQEIEVFSDDRSFVRGLLRWCGAGYGRVDSVEETVTGDHFVVSVSSRQECAQFGLGRRSPAGADRS
jgi:TusA-related sulfurtransferase